MDITKQFIEQLSQMTDAELRNVNDRIVAQLKYRRRMAVNHAKNRLYIGARCTVHHPKANGKVFIVQRINPKNVKCIDADNPLSTWNIAATMLNVIE